jgi:hypothetical protein
MPYFNDHIISHNNVEKENKVGDPVQNQLKKIYDNVKNSRRDKRIIKNITDHQIEIPHVHNKNKHLNSSKHKLSHSPHISQLVPPFLKKIFVII